MEFLQILILIFIVLLFLNMLQNLKMLRRQEKVRQKEPFPSISILIPARNEERNIRRCVGSLLKQNYPNFEIIVLDDDSSDRTAEIVVKLSRNYERIGIVKGEKLPPGWNGKNWACHQLSGLAKGEWFLFTDADTTHKPHSVPEALQHRRKQLNIYRQRA